MLSLMVVQILIIYYIIPQGGGTRGGGPMEACVVRAVLKPKDGLVTKSEYEHTCDCSLPHSTVPPGGVPQSHTSHLALRSSWPCEYSHFTFIQ